MVRLVCLKSYARVWAALSVSANLMRILLVNDDGILAPGLKALERLARTLSKDVLVVAPETEQSAASHSLTLHRPLSLRRISARRWAS